MARTLKVTDQGLDVWLRERFPFRFNYTLNQTNMQHQVTGPMQLSLERRLCSCFMRRNNKHRKKKLEVIMVHSIIIH